MIILLLGFFTFTKSKNQKMKSKITLIVLALVLVSCKAKKEIAEYKPIAPVEQKAEVLTVVEQPATLSPVEENPETIELAATYDGRNLYGNNCGNCHEHYSPADYSKEKWVPIMQRMQKKARTTDAETLAIYNYLATQTK